MIYDYQCRECEHTFEKNISMSRRDEPTKEPCPNCGKVDTVFIAILGTKPVMQSYTIGDKGFKNTPKEFSDFLNQVRKANKGSTIKDRT